MMSSTPAKLSDAVSDTTTTMQQLLERLTAEVSTAAELAVGLEHTICVFVDLSKEDNKEHFQSLDLLIQMLTNIRKAMEAIADDNEMDRPIVVSSFIQALNLRDMSDRLMGVTGNAQHGANGDIDFF